MEQTSLYVFMGLTRSGKTSLARVWAEKHGFAYFNYEETGRELPGIDPEEGEVIESGSREDSPAALSRQIYEALLLKADDELQRTKRCVVLDASYLAREERERVVRFASRIGCRLCFILCYCGREETRKRIEQEKEGDTRAQQAAWDQFKSQEELLDPVDELDQDMLISIQTNAPMKTLLDVLDRGTGLKKVTRHRI